MQKYKLAVCIGDEVYQNRFVRCLMKHYPNQFEVHIFTQIAELRQLKAQEYEVIIVGDCAKEELEGFVNRGDKCLYLCEEKEEASDTQTMVFTEKYQEVYKITDVIEKMIGTAIQNVSEKNAHTFGRIIGVCSFTQEKLQLPFSVTLCSICKEKEPAILLDLQAFSGLETECKPNEVSLGKINLINASSVDMGASIDKMSEKYWEESLGMEDMMTIAMTGEYTKSRLLAAIGREADFDYVHSVKNPECLAEGTLEIYKNMIKILIEDMGYHTIIINFGSMFSGMLELMEACQDFYLLTAKGEGVSWRECAFREILTSRGNENFFHKMTRFEVPTIYGMDENWKQLAQNFRWNEIGNKLREQIQVTEGFE